MVDIPLDIVANDKASRQFDILDRKIGGISVGSVAKLGLAAGAVGVAFNAVSGIIGGTLGKLDEIGKSATRLGLSTDAVQKLGFAAEQSGTSFEKVENAIFKMASSLDDANLKPGSPAALAIDNLGLNINSLLELSPEEQFLKISDAISQLETPGQQAAAAMDIFGGSSKELLPLLQSGSDAIKNMGDQYAATGAIIDEEAVRQAEATNDSLNEMSKTLGSVKDNIVIALLPVIQEALRLFSEYVVPAFRDYIIPAIELFGQGIGVVAVAVYDAVSAMIKFFIDLDDNVVRIFNNIVNGIKGFINTIIGYIEAMPNAFIRGINTMLSAWNSLSFTVPSVDLGPLGKLGGQTFSVPSINLLAPVSLPRLAAGGIVTQPTNAIIGEAGPEAVIPLSQLRQLLGNRETSVVLTLDSEILGQAVIRNVVNGQAGGALGVI